MPKLFNKSQNLKCYRYNSAHKSFEVFPQFSVTLTYTIFGRAYSMDGGCRRDILYHGYFFNILQKARHFHLVVFIKNMVSVILI